MNKMKWILIIIIASASLTGCCAKKNPRSEHPQWVKKIFAPLYKFDECVVEEVLW